MGILEPEFSKLHWPPLVREVVQTVQYPGYRYEFFKSFRELDSYFAEHVSPDWKHEAWAEYWINQHLETKNNDRRELESKLQPALNKAYRTGARDMQQISKLTFAYLNENPKTSSYKISMWLKSHGIEVSQKSAWRMLRKWKSDPDRLVYNTATHKYVSNAYLHNVITPLGTPIPEGYTKIQWRKDWNQKYGLC